MYTNLGELFWGLVRGEWWSFCENVGIPDWLRGRFPDHTPGFITDSGATWYYKLFCAGNRPSGFCVTIWNDAVRFAFAKWLSNQIDSGLTTVRTWVTNITGAVPSGWSTLGQAIGKALDWIGQGLPYFAPTIAIGLGWLYGRLPKSVREGLTTWPEIWNNLKAEVRDWTKRWFTPVVEKANNAWGWILGKGDQVYTFYLDGRTLVENLKAHPLDTVLDWLGVSYGQWHTFWTDPLDYILFKWGLCKAEVREFFDHPVLWLLDRFDDEIAEAGTGLILSVGELGRKILVRLW